MVIKILLAALILAGFLFGIRFMQSPQTALFGNRLGVLSMGAAFLFAVFEFGVYTSYLFWIFVLAGGLLGLLWGWKVQMIQMPQTVAFFNGSGGAASAVVAGSSALFAPYEGGIVFYLTAALALGIGTLTFFGSLIAAGKLQGFFAQRPLQFPAHGALLVVLLVTGGALVVVSPIDGGAFFRGTWFFLVPLFALYGLLMSLRVGGADMPVLISFLNSLSGMAAAVAGLAVENLVLVGAGALVGVAGLILTGLMCRAMNRSLQAVLSGFKPAAAPVREVEEEAAEPQPPAEAPLAETETEEPLEPGESIPVEEKEGEVAEEDKGDIAAKGSPEERAAAVLREAQKVIVVPGYGMAVAQAQGEVKTLVDILEGQGKEVKIAIHPVAGRMPGHMNVLLAEVGIEYDKLHDMESINPEFEETDAVIVVGACDVVNPAASSAEGTPIYGMPILEAHRAGNVIVCNLDDSPGYSGVPNTLYQLEHVVALWGDAKETLDRLNAGIS